jgi:hypothetical protein
MMLIFRYMLGGVASMLSVVQDELIKDVEHFSEVGRAKFMHTVPVQIISGPTRSPSGLRI